MTELLADAVEKPYVQPPYVRKVPEGIREAVLLQEAGTPLEEPESGEKVFSDGDFAVLVEKILSEIGNEHPYHNRRHTEEVMVRLEVLMDQCEPELSPRQRQLNLLRALFHDLGHCGRTIRQDCGGTYEETVHDREDVSNEEYAAQRVREMLAEKLGGAEIVYVQTGILGTSSGQTSGPYKRAYAPRSITEKLLALADIGKFMDGDVDAWMDESFRVLEEMPSGKLPKDFATFMAGRLAFVDYCRTLVEEVSFRDALYRDVLKKRLDSLHETLVVWRDAAHHAEQLSVQARTAGAPQEWSALTTIHSALRHKERFERLWHERVCNIADFDLLTRLFAQDGTVKSELEPELRFLTNRAVSDSDFVGWKRRDIEQVYVPAYNATGELRHVRMRRVVENGQVRWVIGQKKKKLEGSTITKEERNIRTTDGTPDAKEIQRLWQYRKDPTLAKTRYCKEFTFTHKEKTYHCEMHVDVHRGPGNLAGFVRIEIEFDDDDAAQVFRDNRDVIIRGNNVLNFVGREVTNEEHYSASGLAVTGRPGA